MASKLHLVGLVTLLFFGTACEDTEVLPIIPEVTSVTVTPTSGVKGNVLIGFQDGDGDLGLFESDTLAPRNFEPLTCIINGEEVELNTVSDNEAYYNLVIYFEEFVNGEWIPKEACESILLSRRVPIPEPEGQDKLLIGEMDYPDVDIFVLNSPEDTLRIGVKLIDQELHESEVVYSDMFIRP